MEAFEILAAFNSQQREAQEEAEEELYRLQQQDIATINNNLEAATVLAPLPPPTFSNVHVSSTTSTATSATSSTWLLLSATCALVLLGSLLTVVTKLMTIPMANYPVALTLETILAYIPFSLIYGIVKWKVGKLTKEDLQYNWMEMVGMGLTSALGQWALIFGTQYTPGPLQVLLSQTAIPFSMVISYFLLDSRYRPRHYAGAVLVFLGILLAVGGSLVNQEIDTFEAGWIVGYILSWIPYSLFSVYIEMLYKQRARSVDPIIFTGIISVIQFAFLLLFMPLFATYLQRHAEPLSYLPTSLTEGFKCLVGINTLPTDDCYPMAPIWVLSFNILNILLVIPSFILLEHGSSNVLWLACTLIVPLSNMAFSLPMIPGSVPMTVANGLALLVIVAGLAIYGFSKKTTIRGINYLRQQSPCLFVKGRAGGGGVGFEMVAPPPASVSSSSSSSSSQGEHGEGERGMGAGPTAAANVQSGAVVRESSSRV